MDFGDITSFAGGATDTASTDVANVENPSTFSGAIVTQIIAGIAVAILLIVVVRYAK